MTTSQPDFLFNRPGALIAALPAVLGFVPEKSLVLVNLERGAMGAVMRVDLSPQLTAGVHELAEVAAAARPDAAIAVIVDADGALCPLCADDHRELVDALTESLAAQGITLYAAHVVDKVALGGRWHCADGCGARGSVDDPSASPLAVAAVLDGRRLYERRSDLEKVIAVADPERQNAVAGLIARQLETRAAQHRNDPDGCSRRDIEHAMAVAAQVAAGRGLSDAEIARLACALTDIQARDTLFALAVGKKAAEAESLWAALSRALPDPWRVEALGLLAFSAYARGDGPLAGVALEAALRADPTHRMAGMLDTALQSGMRPERIRELAVTGYRLAERLGVRLPPRQGFGRRAC
jgi:Domain of unknown function (DUF4192)